MTRLNFAPILVITINLIFKYICGKTADLIGSKFFLKVPSSVALLCHFFLCMINPNVHNWKRTKIRTYLSIICMATFRHLSSSGWLGEAIETLRSTRGPLSLFKITDERHCKSDSLTNFKLCCAVFSLFSCSKMVDCPLFSMCILISSLFFLRCFTVYRCLNEY